MKRIYLDYNATTPIDPRVKDVLVQELDSYANGSSMHEDGRNEAKKIARARGYVASLINAKPDEIIFTSGGSESNNTVFNIMTTDAITRTSRLQKAYGGRKTVITSSIEHPCVMESAKRLEKLGFQVHYLPVDSYGIVDIDFYRDLLAQGEKSGSIADKVLFVSIMMANNEIGTIQNIPVLAKMAHEAGALFHTDAVQAAGKIPVDVDLLDVDYLTLSAHKIYGPKGIGALYIKENSPVEAFIKGGHQENGLRAGTYNSPAIIAFGEAARLARTQLPEYENHTRALRNKLRDGFLAHIPDIRINGHPDFVLPNTLDVSFPGAEGEAILLMLDMLGISVSTGSACASGSLEPSHVLMATGVGPELAHGSIRFSLGKYTTDEDIDYVLKEVPPVIKKLRGFSTVSSKGSKK
ncbi:aminotransferase class V-fold PLP-dependent enzyme [Brucepastera parasyntrophica]|uniref:cysteine desulfurase family protein n=1 Tax=Brucepastera parasyntrophica TaxID=2880008 RepID=UPI00210F03F4|nr:aminotransferase class V-fold PLP-dependent enzyme [Brucepastera parasyntrophica]ULQ59668.1 aminotransferase class V-fold PLP-dependent enzyme [Brucepastera parasyntrophica]